MDKSSEWAEQNQERRDNTPMGRALYKAVRLAEAWVCITGLVDLPTQKGNCFKKIAVSEASLLASRRSQTAGLSCVGQNKAFHSPRW